MPGFQSRPQARSDSNFNINQEFFIEESFRGQYTGTNLIFAGFAKPGANEDEPVWQISFLTYDGSNNVLSIQWPLRKVDAYDITSDDTNMPSNDYGFIWSERANYTYV